MSKARAIATAADTDTEGRILYLKPRVQQWAWARDASSKAKVKRIGFFVVPENRGTVHGFCETTLDAALADLLGWYRRPSREDLLKA